MLGTVFFLYSCVAIILMAVACSTSIAVWVISHRRTAVYLAIVFAAYGAELIVVLLNEYTRAKALSTVRFESASGHPMLDVLTSSLLVIPVFLWVLERSYSTISRKHAVAMAVAWVAAMILLMPLGGPGAPLRHFAFWLCRDLALLACAVYFVWRTRHVEGESHKRDLEWVGRVGVGAIVCILCVMAEDTYVILFYRPEVADDFTSQLAWYLSGRNITENISMLAASCLVVVTNLRTFLVYFLYHPFATTMKDEASDSISGISDRLALYCERHALSDREREVLNLAVGGEQVQEMASQLSLSPATIRVHLHRIYGKVGVDGKDQLIEDFWKN